MTSLLPNDAHMDYVLSLADIPQRDAERTGAKAATLGELARAGFPVRDGFVLTTDAFVRFLADNAFGPDISPEAVIAATLPTNIAEALRASANALGDVPLAVRFSGSAEAPRSDGADVSHCYRRRDPPGRRLLAAVTSPLAGRD
jgi:phosphoenolpyruvate synthase/pyruvate phosphate dikinase